MNKDVVVKISRINKKGVFAKRDFRKGEVVLVWEPKVLSEAEFNKTKNNQKIYVEITSDPRKIFLMQEPEKFVNHSCEPNTEIKNNCDVAIRDIKKGEEITSDYGKGILFSFECKCGSKKCRGIIN